jgi:hypothetical protein
MASLLDETTPRPLTTVRKKEEQIDGEEPEENRSRRWFPFRRPALGTFPKTDGSGGAAFDFMGLERFQRGAFVPAEVERSRPPWAFVKGLHGL